MLEFFLVFLFDLCELLSNNTMVVRHAVQLCHGPFGFFNSSMSVGVPRTLGEKADTNTEDENPEK
jgi:hypothetical protein